MPNPRPPYPLHAVTVLDTRRVTPYMKRITIDASCLTGLRPDLPTQWFKVFIPAADGSLSGGRAYTVRHFDAETRLLDIDFVLHGDNGPLSAWAERAMIGDHLEISDVHPRSGFAIDPGIHDYLLFGDETALPAIGAILEALPGHVRARVFIEVRKAEAEQALTSRATLSITWLHGVDLLLQAAAQTVEAQNPPMAIWVAAESSQVTAIRRLLLKERSIDKSSLHATGYWKRGEADHRDDEG